MGNNNALDLIKKAAKANGLDTKRGNDNELIISLDKDTDICIGVVSSEPVADFVKRMQAERNARRCPKSYRSSD